MIKTKDYKITIMYLVVDRIDSNKSTVLQCTLFQNKPDSGEFPILALNV